MSLRLMDRVVRLLRADAHGMVEALEDRALLLAQHLREAELELGRKRARIEELAEEERRLARALAAEEETAGTLDEDARLALAGGRDELARFAIRRWITARRRVEALEARRARAGEERASLAERIGDQAERLEALRARVRTERARACTPTPERDAAVADEEVELELLRRRGSGESPR